MLDLPCAARDIGSNQSARSRRTGAWVGRRETPQVGAIRTNLSGHPRTTCQPLPRLTTTTLQDGHSRGEPVILKPGSAEPLTLTGQYHKPDPTMLPWSAMRSTWPTSFQFLPDHLRT